MLNSIYSAAAKTVDFLQYVPVVSTPIGLTQIVHGYAQKKFCEFKAERAKTTDEKKDWNWKAYQAKLQIERGVITAIPFGKLVVVNIIVPTLRKALFE